MRENAVVANVEKVVAGRLPVRVTVMEVVSAEVVGNSVIPFDGNDWCYKKQDQDHKCDDSYDDGRTYSLSLLAQDLFLLHL